MRKIRECLYVGMVGILLGIGILGGCAGTGEYGKLASANSAPGDVSIGELIENSDRYNVFYSGSSARPGAVLFEPRQNDGRIEADSGWKPIAEAGTIDGIIMIMQEDFTNVPYLKVIQDGQDNFYGFLYSSRNTTVKQLSDAPRTVKVYPVSLDSGANGSGSVGGGCG